MTISAKSLILHLAVIALIFLLHFVLPEYHHGIVARVMVLAIFAMAYNLTFGYTGLLSLGHALFFAAGMYGMGLGITLLELPTLLGVVFGVIFAGLVSAVIGYLALRTAGVALMIVTLMFAQRKG